MSFNRLAAKTGQERSTSTAKTVFNHCFSVGLGFLHLSNCPLSVHHRNRRNGYPTMGENKTALTGGFAMDENKSFDFDSYFRHYLLSSTDA